MSCIVNTGGLYSTYCVYIQNKHFHKLCMYANTFCIEIDVFFFCFPSLKKISFENVRLLACFFVSPLSSLSCTRCDVMARHRPLVFSNGHSSVTAPHHTERQKCLRWSICRRPHNINTGTKNRRDDEDPFFPFKKRDSVMCACAVTFRCSLAALTNQLSTSFFCQYSWNCVS